MLTLSDINTIEGEDPVTDSEYYSSIQRAINEGSWALQGSYGRSMMAAIEAGYCLLGREGFKDYWGNYIPSRDQVKAGTKGSIDFVDSAMGQKWAALMEGI